MRINKEMFDNMTHEEKETFRKRGDAIMHLMASMGDKDAILGIEMLKLCEKFRDMHIKVMREDDETKDRLINLVKQLKKIIDDFEKEMEK